MRELLCLFRKGGTEMICSKCGYEFAESERASDESATCPGCDKEEIGWAHYHLALAREELKEKCDECYAKYSKPNCKRYCGTRTFLEEMDRVQLEGRD